MEDGDSGGDSDTMESQESTEVKVEVDRSYDGVEQWMVTGETDYQESSQRLPSVQTPVMSQRIRDDADRMARAFYLYQSQNGIKKRSRLSSGRRPGRPWTHTSLKVVCLDVRPREELGRTPSAQHIAELSSFGLGIAAGANERGVCYFKNCELASRFHERIEELYPRLIPGHYCFGAASKGSNLSEIYKFETLTVEEVKKVLNQGRLYIVPFALRELEEVGLQRPAVSPMLGLPGAQEQSYSPSSPHPDFQTDMEDSLQEDSFREESSLRTSDSPPPPVPQPVHFPPTPKHTPWRSGEPAYPTTPEQSLRTGPRCPPRTAAESGLRMSVSRAASRPVHRMPSQPSHQPPVPVGVPVAGRGTPAAQLECRSFDDMVLRLRPVPPDNSKIPLNIHRSNFLQDARRGFFRQGVDLRRQTHVKFVGSSDVDNGGLSAQFRAELVQHLRDSAIFAGPENAKSLVYSYFCVEEEMYRHIGVMLAYVIAHGGPYPAFFSSKLYSLLLGEDTELDVEDVQEPTLRRLLEQLQAAETQEELQAAQDALKGVLALTGLQPARMQKKQLLLCLVDFLGNQMMHVPLKQLREGLSELGVLPLIQRNLEVGRAFLVAQVQPSVSVEALRDLWTCDIDGTSATGREEMRIHGYFLDLLLDLDETQRKQLLKFCTGQDRLPAEGFHQQPSLTFSHHDTLPSADVHTLELTLPVTTSAHSFNTAMLAALGSVEDSMAAKTDIMSQ